MQKKEVKATVNEVKDTAKAVETKAKETVKAVEDKAKETAKVAETKAKETAKVAEATAEKTVATAKTTAKKAKATAKKTVAKAAAKTAEVKPEIIVQYQNNEVEIAKVEERVKAQFVSEGHRAGSIKKLNIYIKPEEYSAYYVINEKFSGRVDLF